MHSSLQKWRPESWCIPGTEAWHQQKADLRGECCGPGSSSQPWESLTSSLSISHPPGTSTFMFWCGSRSRFWGEPPDRPHLPRFGLRSSGEQTKWMQMALKQKTDARSASDAFWVLMGPSDHKLRLEWIWRKTYGDVWMLFTSLAPTDRIRAIHATCLYRCILVGVT